MIFRQDVGQITFDPVENAFATQQLDFLATSIAFWCIVTRACAEIKILKGKVTYVFRLFDFWNFFSPFLFPLFLLSPAVNDLLLGLLAVKTLLRKRHRDR